MIDIVKKENCCGCSACASICPKQCISMECDSEGFLYPQVNKTVCVSCGLCEKVCNELHPYEEHTPLKVLAAKNKNDSVRLRSSSGGIFHILAENIIEEGGVVFGARFDAEWQVVIDYADTKEGIEAFMGSKYVQARIADAYKDAKRFLSEGRKVMFSGTPCQIAGLHKFLRKKYENLLTVDFVCHGTPSPKVWNMYLREELEKVKHISCVGFRDKSNGWKNFCFVIRGNEGTDTVSVISPFQQNPYMNVFLKNIILRPSCYSCNTRCGRSCSDITMADFWGIDKLVLNMDDDKGTSMVFINTPKGENAFVYEKCNYVETAYDNVLPLNPACRISPKKNPKRDYFFSQLESMNLIDLMKECSKPSRQERYKILKKNVKLAIKKILGIAPRMNGGVNSPQRFFSQNKITDADIVGIHFRNKMYGWKTYSIEIEFKLNKQD